MLKGKIILGTSLALSAILACCVAVSCNSLQHDKHEHSTEASIRERFFVHIGKADNIRLFSYGEGKTHKDRVMSLVEHSLLYVEEAPNSQEWGQLHSPQGLLYVVTREDLPLQERLRAWSTDKGIRIEEEGQ